MVRTCELQPFKHIDLFGTVLLPGLLLMRLPFLFGYAKPVPVNFRALRRPRRDMVLVAAAGPAMDIALAGARSASTRNHSGVIRRPLKGPLLGARLRLDLGAASHVLAASADTTIEEILRVTGNA